MGNTLRRTIIEMSRLFDGEAIEDLTKLEGEIMEKLSDLNLLDCDANGVIYTLDASQVLL